MTNKILKFIQEYQMIVPGDHVICALSGGIDSMALLHLLLDMQSELAFTLSAAHFDHQLRGEESRRDAEFVKKHCAELGVPLHFGSADVSAYAASEHLGIEDAARHLRYAFLLSIEEQTKIATAHNADDNLETMLLRLIRGTGLHGLGAIPPMRDRIIRPLLTTERADLADYLAKHNIPHVEDSTNASEDYLRNRIRHGVIPLLTKENPEIARRTSELCLELRSADAFLQETASDAFSRISKENELSCTGLFSLPAAQRAPVMARFLQPVPELSRRQISAAFSLAENHCPSAELHLSGGYILRRSYDSMLLQQADACPLPTEPCPLPLEGQPLSYGCYHISYGTGLSTAELPADTLAVLPRSDYSIRTRRPGDRITLPGGTKKLSRYLIDQKIPAHIRDQLPILCADDKVVAVLPLCVDRNFLPEPNGPCLLIHAVSKTPEPQRKNCTKGMEEPK